MQASRMKMGNVRPEGGSLPLAPAYRLSIELYSEYGALLQMLHGSFQRGLRPLKVAEVCQPRLNDLSRCFLRPDYRVVTPPNAPESI